MAGINSERILNVGEDAAQEPSFTPQPVQVTRATDPVLNPAYTTPGDFAGQYPTPLDPTEFLDMCEEVSVLKAIPEMRTALQAYTWREMSMLHMISGSTAAPDYLFFADGYCPEEYEHSGSNQTVTLKNIGAKKNLGISDIMHSQAVAGMGFGINTLIGGLPSGEGLPGAYDMATFQRESVANLKEKEVRLAASLVLNGWDYYLIQGNTSTSSLQFDGIENWASNMSCSFHTRSSTDLAASGTFTASAYDRFLSESCAKPTMIFGHSAAIQEFMSSYFQLGFQGSQVINFSDGGRLTPGFNFSSFVNTGVGRLQVVADNNFTRTNTGGTTFQGRLYGLRMSHNGQPLVYRITQIPFGIRDLVPGCTAISFEVWAKTALIIKMCCAQSYWQGQFSGRVTTTCNSVY